MSLLGEPSGRFSLALCFGSPFVAVEPQGFSSGQPGGADANDSTHAAQSSDARAIDGKRLSCASGFVPQRAPNTHKIGRVMRWFRRIRTGSGSGRPYMYPQGDDDDDKDDDDKDDDDEGSDDGGDDGGDGGD